MLKCYGWLLGRCYVVFKVLWVVARACVFAKVFWIIARTFFDGC